MNLKAIPPLYLLLLIILSLGLHYFFPVAEIISFPYRYLGLLFIILGLYLAQHTIRIYKKLQNPLNPTSIPKVLITSGAFRISRNPIYLGLFLVLVGEAFLLGSLTTFLAPVLFIIIIDIWVIRIEEENLKKQFGNEYLAYKKKVKRWI